MEIVKILIVEDDIGFAYLVQHQLTNLGFQSQFILTVHTLEDARLAHLEFEIDVILLDLNLKESQGIETFNEINSIFPSASIIVLTGLDEKALALNIVAKGAQDYLLKTNLSSQVLEKTINYGMLRRKVRVELSKSEKKYKDVFQKSPLPMLKLEGSELIVVMANKAALDLYSVNKEDFIGQSIYSFNKFQEEKFIELETSNSIRTIFNLKTSDKKLKIIEIVINKLEEGVNEFIALMIDKTEEVLFEKQKFDLINHAEEREKKNIARELHDGLGQQLVLLNLLFQNIEASKEQEVQMNDIGLLLQTCIREVKELAYDLLPPELDRGFLHAIDRLKNRINIIGKIEFELNIGKEILESHFVNVDKFNLYRIVQEIVNNALKHSKATNINFKIYHKDNGINIEIIDNGIGFDSQTAQKGMGIHNIQHRLKMSGIKGEFISAPNHGVKVKLTLSVD
jgi:signal transduction histidine kinase